MKPFFGNHTYDRGGRPTTVGSSVQLYSPKTDYGLDPQVCRQLPSSSCQRGSSMTYVLTERELERAETYWWTIAQQSEFMTEITSLREGKGIRQSSRLLPFHPFLDAQGLLHVCGRMDQVRLPHPKRHPVLLPGSHSLTRIVYSEHLHLLHAGPTLVSASLSHKMCILNNRRVIRSIVRNCIIWKRVSSRPKPQIFGQLPADRLNPGTVFDCVGVSHIF